MKKLSIIILSYNTQKLLKDCLESVYKFENEADFEVIVVDNGSTDGSFEMVKKDFPKALTVRNKENLGFAKGNNAARSLANGEYILFLNSDTLLQKSALKKSLSFIRRHKDVGALSCKLVLPDGTLDRDARRAFPTPWVALTHFSGIDRLFSKSELLAKYWYLYKSADLTQDVDVLQGAFFLTRREVLDSVDWFSEEYFLDGEDIDLCWKIKQKGLRIVYYPEVFITHIKGASKGKRKSSFLRITQEERLNVINVGLDSMAIFYKKWLWSRYPLPLNWLVLLGISSLRFLRYIKAIIS
jgi:GT2 family glycosyltransferase